MANERLWGNAAAPVDVGDIDVVGIVGLSVRRLGADVVLDSLRAVTEDLPALARIPLEVAIEMVRQLPERYEQD